MFENQQPGMAGFNPLANMKPGYYRPGPAPMPEPWPSPYSRDVGDLWVLVSSLKDAENAFVQPGQTKWFMVQNKMQFAVKSVSGAGVTDYQAFDFAPHVEAQPVQQDAGIVSVPVAALDEILNKVQSVVDRVAKIEDVEAYAKAATQYKAEYKDLADIFAGMATAEMAHLKNMHLWVVKLIDKEKKEGKRDVPQGMLDVWAWEHKKMIERFNAAEVALQNYQKL